jgi:hypothetical protein
MTPDQATAAFEKLGSATNLTAVRLAKLAARTLARVRGLDKDSEHQVMLELGERYAAALHDLTATMDETIQTEFKLQLAREAGSEEAKEGEVVS